MSSFKSRPLTARAAAFSMLLQIVCAAALASIASTFLGGPLWTLNADELVPLVALSASYLVCAAFLLWRESRTGSRAWGSPLLLLAVAYAPSLLIIVLEKVELPRRVVLAEIALGGVLLLTAVLVRRRAGWLIATLIVAIVGLAIQVPFLLKDSQTDAGPTTVAWLVNSSLYPLELTEYRNWFDEPLVEGGGITSVGDRYLLGTGDGNLYVIAEDRAEPKLDVHRVPYKVPINTDAFNAAEGMRLDGASFRVADVLVQEAPGKTRLFASHYFWNAAQKCFVVRVSMLEGVDSTFLTGSQPGLSWRTIFESSPCVPIDLPGQPPHFAGIQIGGRLALLSDHELLVTLGDNELDGWNSPMSAPQDPKSSYGKTIVIDLRDFGSQNFTIGHRNPEGLYVDGSKAIWLTEHGPQGGDELNLLKRGANYGWPVETYGVEYGTHAWPFDAVPGSHDDFTEPFYSWTPSIGVSNLLVSSSPLFKLWNGDLIVSSLKDMAIYRMRVRESRVVENERIAVGERIRDIMEGHKGELLVWTDSGALLVLRVDHGVGGGEQVFRACSGCHAIDWEHHGIGPDLFHVVNRKVGTSPGFKYSAAMKSFGGKWTPERLDAFLTNPQAFMPGTAMRFPGISDPATRAKLITYLWSSVNHPVKHRLWPKEDSGASR